MKANLDIRIYAQQKNVYMWQIAEALKYSESNFCRVLRTELSKDRKEIVFNAIDELSAGNTDYTTIALHSLRFQQSIMTGERASEHIALAITPSLKKDLDELARERQWTRAYAIKYILSKYIPIDRKEYETESLSPYR